MMIATRDGACAASAVGCALAALYVWRCRCSRPLTSHPPLVGILGGLGPLASALLVRLLVKEAEGAGASFDSDHPRFILYQDPKLPNSRLAALGEGPTPVDGMVRAFRALLLAGASEVCVCCNTAHPFAREAAARAGAPFLDMIEITAHAALERLASVPDAAPVRVGLLGTDATLRLGLYQHALAEAATRLWGVARRLEVVVPDAAGVHAMQQCILQIKAGTTDGVGDRIEGVARALVVECGAQCLITGCTELPTCFSEDSHPHFAVPIVSPVSTLAAAIVRRDLEGSGENSHAERR